MRVLVFNVCPAADVALVRDVNDVSLRTSASGSRTLSRFGIGDEQIYLVIRDDKNLNFI